MRTSFTALLDRYVREYLTPRLTEWYLGVLESEGHPTTFAAARQAVPAFSGLEPHMVRYRYSDGTMTDTWVVDAPEAASRMLDQWADHARSKVRELVAKHHDRTVDRWAAKYPTFVRSLGRACTDDEYESASFEAREVGAAARALRSAALEAGCTRREAAALAYAYGRELLDDLRSAAGTPDDANHDVAPRGIAGRDSADSDQSFLTESDYDGGVAVGLGYVTEGHELDAEAEQRFYEVLAHQSMLREHGECGFWEAAESLGALVIVGREQ